MPVLVRTAALTALFSLTLLHRPPALAQQADGKTDSKLDSGVPGSIMSPCPLPKWPTESLRRNQTGAVMLSFLIAEDGSVVDAKIVESSGYPLLDEAAMEGLRPCKLRPKIKDGVPTAAWVKMQYIWTLEDAEPPTKSQVTTFLKDARRGDATAQYLLGTYYAEAPRQEQDLPQSVHWLRAAAEQGHIKAQLQLGIALMRGKGEPANLPAAAGYLAKAAAEGNASAQHILGEMNMAGLGIPQDIPAARALLKQSAARDYSPGMASYGTLLLKAPETELERDDAVHWLRKAAARENPQAIYTLGTAYEEGNGVPRDYAQAASLYKRAIAGGVRRAQLALARLYENGQGVAADAEKAHQLRLSADLPQSK